LIEMGRAWKRGVAAQRLARMPDSERSYGVAVLVAVGVFVVVGVGELAGAAVGVVALFGAFELELTWGALILK
jgi:hypothetical protein